jgi:hypothetical protein
MFGLVLAALLIALFVFALVRRGTWRQPRAVLFVLGFVVAGLLLGAVIGLVLAVSSASAAALYGLLAAIIAFEAYRWTRRRRRRT